MSGREDSFGQRVLAFLFPRPRGLAGALLVIKVAGAMAEQGKTMSEIVDVCQDIRAHLRTIGLSASGVRPPGQQQSFEVDPTATFLLNVRVLYVCRSSCSRTRWNLEWVFMVKVERRN